MPLVVADNSPIRYLVSFGTHLDPGERAAIALALALRVDLMLVDDRQGVHAARVHGLTVIGTIGIPDLAAQKRMISLRDAFSRLKTTNFRYPIQLLVTLLDRDAARSENG